MNTVADIMSRKVISVTRSMPLEELIRLLVDRGVSGAPVIDTDGKPIGMVSKSDLISEDYEWAETRSEAMPWQRLAGRSVAKDRELFSERNLAGRTVADLMTSAALSISPTASVKEAAQQMVRHHVHRLVVLDADQRLIGVVTTSDVNRWVAESPEIR